MQQHRPEVSVIVPAYNAEQYIAEAITSVLEQSFADFELIVVNDGSTDATEEAIRRIRDPRMSLIRQDNQGPSAARNAGIALSTGRYVAFLDADDSWHMNKLERQLGYIADGEVCAVFSWVDAVDDDDPPHEATDVMAWINRACSSRAEMVAQLFNIGNFLCNSTALVTREALIGAGGLCLSAIQTQDFDLWVKLIKMGHIGVLSDRLVTYRKRVHSSSITFDPANADRLTFEYRQIYRTMFDSMPASLFDEAFPNRRRQAEASTEANFELEKAFLYLEHSEPSIRMLGLEKLYVLMQSPAIVELAAADYDFTLPDYFALTRSIPLSDEVTGWNGDWQHIALERGATIAELRAWIATQEEAVRWHDEQRQSWQRLAQEREGAVNWQDQQRHIGQQVAQGSGTRDTKARVGHALPRAIGAPARLLASWRSARRPSRS